MKFVKRISLFFIYPLVMYALGFASNMFIMEIFYPGTQQIKSQENHIYYEPEIEKDIQSDELEVAVTDQQIVTANTEYIIEKFNRNSGKSTQEKTIAPDKYIGLNRERLVQEIEEYNQSPPLVELNEGFCYIELVTFSPSRIVVRKSYETKEDKATFDTKKGFFLLNENHYVVVYDHKMENIYMNTGILVEELPQELQNEIIHMKFIDNEGELFNFLESFSS